MTTTIKDVAKAAGVSISTVSNALNGVDVLKPKTRDHILEVAAQLNYIPNVNGQNLKACETKVIGLFVTNLKGPYYGTLVDAVYDACDCYGYQLQIFVSKKKETTLATVLGRRIDAAVIFTEFIQSEDLDLLDKTKIPMVFLDREINRNTMSSILFDSCHGAEQLTNHLLSLGHKRIAYIQGYCHNYDNIERLRGFKNVLKKHRIPFSEELLLDGYFNERASFLAVKSYLESEALLPDVFFAANDLSAIGCIKALHTEGISVPQDVGVVGFDDIEISALFSPALTTVRNPITTQGTRAVDLIISMLKKQSAGCVEKLEGRLMVRDSCGRKQKRE